MPTQSLKPAEIRIQIDPDSLGFKDTSALEHYPLSWIGQERAEKATHFGLAMQQPDYHLFVLGEAGSGRSSLLHQAMITEAAKRPAPPDLCYLYNFITPENPLALYLPAGQGRQLRQCLSHFTQSLPDEITRCLDGQEFKIKHEQLLKKYSDAEIRHYAKLDTFAEKRNFSIRREADQIVFTLLDAHGKILTENNLFKLPKTRRTEINQAEQQLHAAIIDFFEETKRINSDRDAATMALKRNIIKPLLNQAIKKIRDSLDRKINNDTQLKTYFSQIIQDILDNLSLFEINHGKDEKQHNELQQVLSRYQVNLIVDNHALCGAPVILEDNPLMHALFGNIDYQPENEKIKADFMRIHAGSFHKAHGGFIMLHLDDLLTDTAVWTKLRRFLRCNRLQIEEQASILTASIPAPIVPEAVHVNIKIVLIGSREDFYFLQDEDPEFIRRFRIKVDFADSFKSNPETYYASSIFVAHICKSKKLPHFTAEAVARLLEESHREVDDQTQQSAIFARMEMLILESATFCNARNGDRVECIDITAALEARTLRHNYPDQWLQEAIADGDIAITLQGEEIGQLNAITQIDMGDHCFGIPVRITAHTFAGEDGLLNIAHEVNMSGPIHDKGVLILQNYLSALFAHLAPLALNASIVFEQEYSVIEGDSASCAEFFALISSLSRIPVKQSIAITGALNQYGDVLPVGGINEKIEGFFNICKNSGLTGEQGVLIPDQNQRHLMLDYTVVDAVKQGMFHIYTMKHVTEGIDLLTGLPSGITDKKKKKYSAKTILGYAEKTLIAFRHACLVSHTRPE
ncbi:MAG: AAA family ATPase [Nitrosomonas sp.]|nr:AAA family ATPase [Nitrosomonas sp.]MCW5607896.1 AAA family ATPase [Nitrosomonas sp.]